MMCAPEGYSIAPLASFPWTECVLSGSTTAPWLSSYLASYVPWWESSQIDMPTTDDVVSCCQVAGIGMRVASRLIIEDNIRQYSHKCRLLCARIKGFQQFALPTPPVLLEHHCCSVRNIEGAEDVFVDVSYVRRYIPEAVWFRLLSWRCTCLSI